MYDTAIVGAGPAGLSAALTLKLRGKSIIWFGSAGLSDKVGRSEKIANYPGLLPLSGKALNDRFLNQARDAGLELTDRMVTSITSSKKGYMLLAGNEIYEAETLLLATGASSGKGIEREEELLGSGVSYCATCDGFLYAGKTIAAYCQSRRYEPEIEYLADIAEKVYLYVPYNDCGISLPKVEMLKSPPVKVSGEKKAEGILLADGTEIAVSGVFFMRNSVAPSALLRGLETDGPHIAVDRRCGTNKAGCFAAGDCTGRPYQIAKAVGEGNVAAHSILDYLAESGRNARPSEG